MRRPALGIAAFLLFFSRPVLGRDSSAPTITFFGAAGTIFGSCHLLDTGNEKVLLDCGNFQEEEGMTAEDAAALNREMPFSPSEIDAVFITHAHSDHIGKLPYLVKRGFDGPVYCTPATAELSKVMLKLYAWLNSMGEGLYDESDAEKALARIRTCSEGTAGITGGGTVFTFLEAGHILGSAMVELRWRYRGRDFSLLFTGDLGNPDSPLLRPTSPLPRVDYLVTESTYGDRRHGNFASEIDTFRNVINETVSRGGIVLIPSYILSRTQKIIYFLNELIEGDNFDARFDVYVDSDYANRVSAVYRRYSSLYDDESAALIAARDWPLSFPGLKERKPGPKLRGPAVVIAPSGMASVGNITHHLVRELPDSRNSILLVGYQPEGTVGRQLLDGRTTVEIAGQKVPVRARSYYLGSFSGHPDYEQILAWMGAGERPGAVFVVHGQPGSSANLARLIRERLGVPALVPERGRTYLLTHPAGSADFDRSAPTGAETEKGPGPTGPEPLAPRGIEPLSPD